VSKRIAIVADHASPLGTGDVDGGGQSLYVAQIARHLARLGHEIDVYTRRDSERLPTMVDWTEGVRVIHVAAGPATFIARDDLLQHMGELRAGIEALMDRRSAPYDAVHASFFMSGLVAAELKERRGLPFAVTFHGLGRGTSRGCFGNDRCAIEQRVVREADAIIAEHPRADTELCELYGADQDRVVTIPWGYDPVEIAQVDQVTARNVVGLRPQEPVVLHVDGLAADRGVDHALRGFAQLVEATGLRARLVIVSQGDDRHCADLARVRRLTATLGVGARVVHARPCERAMLRFYYSAADVLVSTPSGEASGASAIEAMACGAVVVGSTIGAIEHAVVDGNTGLLVPPESPDAIGRALVSLFENPALRSMLGRRALRRAREQRTWARSARMLDGVYGAIMQPASHRRATRAWQATSEARLCAGMAPMRLEDGWRWRP
jgi:D-inositol-3-phosphate glycosyltransferase